MRAERTRREEGTGWTRRERESERDGEGEASREDEICREMN
jgi:hypothetical protein